MEYIKGIDALRFFAAFLVVIFHCNYGLWIYDKSLYSTLPILLKGPTAVNFFFIISGFLITILGLHELKTHNSFNVKKFFVRRILRILPLYYLAVFLGFFFIGFIYPIVFGEPFFDFPIVKGFLYYLFLLPNLVIVCWKNIGPMHNLWSIGVEEQFYLIFPLIMVLIKKFRRPFFYLLLFFLSYLLFYLAIYNNSFEINETLKTLVVKTLKFHFILLGVALGYIFFHQKDNLVFIFFGNRVIQIIVIAAFTYILCSSSWSYDRFDFICCSLFAIILINIARGISIINLDIPILNYLGTISYGIYVFHPFVSLGIRFIMMKVTTVQEVLVQMPLLFYLVVTVLTIGISALSYTYYESFFLRFKKRFY